MTGIQNQVSLLQTERISSRIRPLFENLITDTPHDDTWMITVALDEIRQIFLMPFIEETGIIAIRFLAAPHIETLVHYEDAHRIAHIQEFWCRRIMTASDSVHAHIAKDDKLAMHRIFINGSTQATEIMMLTDTINLEILAIEEEALLCIKLHITETGSCRSNIHYLPIYYQLALDSIEISLSNVPEMRIIHFEFLFPNTLILGYDLSGSIIDGVTDREFHLITGSSEIHLHPDITLWRSCYILSPLRNISSFHGFGEPDMAVNTATGIPAAVRLVAVIYLHRNDIITLLINIRCKIILECTVSVRTGSEFMPIDIHGRIHIYSIKGDGKPVILFLRIHREMLTVPSDAARQCTTTGSRRIRRREVALYRPIVRKIQTSPMSV